MPCHGRRAERERGVGIWCDPDRLVWLWSPREGNEQVGIVEVTICPHCQGPLPRVGDAIRKAILDD